MPSHPKPAPKAKKPGALRTKAKAPKAPHEPTHLTTGRAMHKAMEEGATPVEAVKAARPKKAPAAKVPGADTKTDLILGMLKIGATSKEMEAATGWKPHSVRGLLGTLRGKGMKIVSTKLPKEATVYTLHPSEPVGDVV